MSRITDRLSGFLNDGTSGAVIIGLLAVTIALTTLVWLRSRRVSALSKKLAELHAEKEELAALRRSSSPPTVNGHQHRSVVREDGREVYSVASRAEPAPSTPAPVEGGAAELDPPPAPAPTAPAKTVAWGRGKPQGTGDSAASAAWAIGMTTATFPAVRPADLQVPVPVPPTPAPVAPAAPLTPNAPAPTPAWQFAAEAVGGSPAETATPAFLPLSEVNPFVPVPEANPFVPAQPVAAAAPPVSTPIPAGDQIAAPAAAEPAAAALMPPPTVTPATRAPDEWATGAQSPMPAGLSPATAPLPTPTVRDMEPHFPLSTPLAQPPVTATTAPLPRIETLRSIWATTDNGSGAAAHLNGNGGTAHLNGNGGTAHLNGNGGTAHLNGNGGANVAPSGPPDHTASRPAEDVAYAAWDEVTAAGVERAGATSPPVDPTPVAGDPAYTAWTTATTSGRGQPPDEARAGGDDDEDSEGFPLAEWPLARPATDAAPAEITTARVTVDPVTADVVTVAPVTAVTPAPVASPHVTDAIPRIPAGANEPTPPPQAQAEPLAHILLVEDDENVSQVYRHLIEAKGYAIRHAVDGIEGLEMARAERPDLILLDVMMPRMNGILFLQNLRAEPGLRDVPVVILSNFREPRLVERALGLGAVEYMVKAQTRTDALITALPRWLRGERAFTR